MSSDVRTIDGRTVQTAPPRWHRTGRLADGTPIGEFGAFRFVLDEDGEPISPGFHEIRYEDGEYVGTIGASREAIRLSDRDAPP